MKKILFIFFFACFAMIFTALPSSAQSGLDATCFTMEHGYYVGNPFLNGFCSESGEIVYPDGICRQQAAMSAWLGGMTSTCASIAPYKYTSDLYPDFNANMGIRMMEVMWQWIEGNLVTIEPLSWAEQLQFWKLAAEFFAASGAYIWLVFHIDEINAKYQAWYVNCTNQFPNNPEVCGNGYLF